MAVGGTTDTNFVDSAHPTVARINLQLQTPDGQLGLFQRGVKALPGRKPRLNIKPKPLSIPQPSDEFTVLKGHVANDSNGLRKKERV